MKVKAALKSTRTLLRENTHVKKNGSYKWLIVLPIILIVSLLGFSIWYLIKLGSINPQTSLSQQAQNRLLIKRDDLKSTLFVLEEGDNMKIQGAWYVVHNVRNSTTVVYFIPPGVYMRDYLQRTTEYVSTGELKYLGDSAQQNRAIEYAVWQLGNLTGVTPDSYIWLDIKGLTAFSNLFGDVSEYKKENYQELYRGGSTLTQTSFTINSLLDKYSILKLVSNFEEYQKLISGIDTNLSLLELAKRVNDTKSYLSADNLYMMDLGQIWATTKGVSVTEKEINVVNYSEVDKRLGEIVKELKGRDIEREQVKIEVYNASEIEGLAGRYSRKFENSGIEVVRYENAPNTFEETVIYVPKIEEYKKSLELIKQLLFVESKVENSRPSFMTTGDIVVILGKDLALEAVWK